MEEGSSTSGRRSVDRDLLKQGDKPRKGVRWLMRIMGLVKGSLEVALVAALLWLFIFQVSDVHGLSMDPNLAPGDRLVVDKLTHHFRSLRRFEIVVFECPNTGGDDYVKRVVGLPGELVELYKGELYINDEKVAQDFEYIADLSFYGPVRLPDGHYFVLGDNRPDSTDSRASSVGMVVEGMLKGVVRFKVYPFSRAGSVTK